MGPLGLRDLPKQAGLCSPCSLTGTPPQIRPSKILCHVLLLRLFHVSRNDKMPGSLPMRLDLILVLSSSCSTRQHGFHQQWHDTPLASTVR